MPNGAGRDPLTPAFYYKLKLVKSGLLHRNRYQKESIEMWITQQMSIDVEGADWVFDLEVLSESANSLSQTCFS